MDDQNILDEFDPANASLIRRRKLLPWWIKLFCWIFILTSIVATIAAGVGIINGWSFRAEIYGLSTNEPGSFLGIMLTCLFLLKGITGYMLWTEDDWAIMFAMGDAILGILICLFVMIRPFIDRTHYGNINFRFELVLLIPYLLKLRSIKAEWEKKRPGNAIK